MKKLIVRLMLCLLLALLFLTNYLNAQTESGKGIKWAEGLSWEQVKQKARDENKYIFLDCFTTWCGPCKRMDKEVYSNDTVGDYFNKNFISVKLQMDKTRTDNDYVKTWYEEADSIGRWYVTAYPTYLFLSPLGFIVHAESGYRTITDFMSIGQRATKPGTVYKDEAGEYNLLMDEYKQGIRHWDRLPFMIAVAYKNQNDHSENSQDTIWKQMLHEYTDHIAGLPVKKRYTLDNIKLFAEMMPGLILRSDGPRFHFFYKDGKAINKVMKQKYYAEDVVDKTIYYEVLLPFYNTQTGGEIMGPGLVRRGGGADTTEADWKKLYTLLRERFNKSTARRNVINAKIDWYDKHHYRYDLVFKYRLHKLSGIEIDSMNIRIANRINDLGWKCFLGVTDIKVLLETISWMKKVIEHFPNRSDFLDTYANLLYKAGRKEEAVILEESAANLRGGIGLKDILEQMKNDNPTYLDQGADWSGINTISWKNFKFPKQFLVNDERGKPINNAIITIKRSDHFIQCNNKGYGNILVTLGDTLVISCPRYSSEEFTVGKNASLSTIILRPSNDF